MKHLLLYEAFKSKGISKTLKYLSDENIDKTSFLNDLKMFMDNYDIPISDITDENIHYMNRRKAKDVKKPDGYEIMNPYRVYTLKFWFSVSDGYLGSTVISDERPNLMNSLSEKDISRLEKEGLKGSFIKLRNEDLKELKTGDIIVARFGGSIITKATIFIEGNRIYAIQNIYSGALPYSSSWMKYGNYSWSIGRVGRIGNDTRDLHLFKEEVSKDEFILTRWSNSLDILKDSDFCLVIYLDELAGYESVSDIRSIRKDSKSGALALMSPDEIKVANYERYMIGILKSMGFEKDSNFEDLKNLQKITEKVIVGDWALFSILLDEPGLGNILNFSNVIKGGDINKLIDVYKYIISSNKTCKRRYNESSKRVNRLVNEQSKEIIKMYYDLSSKINKKVKKYNLETLGDLLLIYYKLNSLQRFLRSDIEISRGLYRILYNFSYNDGDINTGVEMLNNSDGELDKKTHASIDRFIEKLF